MLTPDVVLSALPSPLNWEIEPAGWRLEPSQSLQITATGDTDLFLDPRGEYQKKNTPRLVFPAPPQFTLSARVAVDFQATYDAGVLLVYSSDTSWAKLCFEFSPQQQPMVVSVVTNQLSDDCNAVVIEGREVFLRITSLGKAFAFHYSLDASFWYLVRYFALHETQQLRAGFSAQSPTGTACTATFHDITFADQSVGDIRSGE